VTGGALVGYVDKKVVV
jgi:hypothetical protein